jgi:hypothetical protein
MLRFAKERKVDWRRLASPACNLNVALQMTTKCTHIWYTNKKGLYICKSLHCKVYSTVFRHILLLNKYNL